MQRRGNAVLSLYVISRCRESVSDLTDAFNVVIREKLEEQVGQEWPGYQKDASSLARIIWNLVDLGYADTYYSENEKKIVRYLVGKWEIDPEVYQEMIDTADTMLALTKQKEWIISTIPKGSKRDSKEKKIDSEIDRMHADLRLTIDELTM